jgi:hypothetical protein
MEAVLLQLIALCSYIIGTAFFAFVTASISNFLDENLEQGKVFEFYGKWVRKEVWQNQAIEQAEKYLKGCCQYTAENITITYDRKGNSEITYGENEKVEVPKWKKPLGACVYCANVWVNIILLGAFSLTFDKSLAFYLVGIVVVAALSNTFLNRINK